MEIWSECASAVSVVITYGASADKVITLEAELGDRGFARVATIPIGAVGGRRVAAVASIPGAVRWRANWEPTDVGVELVIGSTSGMGVHVL